MSSREKHRQQTLDLYRRGIQSFGDRHPKPLQQKYSYPYSDNVPMTWIEESRVMQVEVGDRQVRSVVEVRFPKPRGGSVKLSATCSCSPGLDNVTCQHSLTAAIRLRTFLSGSMIPEVVAVLRG